MTGVNDERKKPIYSAPQQTTALVEINISDKGDIQQRGCSHILS